MWLSDTWMLALLLFPLYKCFPPPPLDVCCLQFDMRFSHVSAIALEWIMPFCCLIPYFYLFLKSCEKKTSEKCWKLCFYLTTKQFLVTSKTSSWVLFRCRSVDINLKDCCGYKRQGFAPTVWTAFKVTDRTSWSSELTEFIAGGQNCHGIWGSPSAFPYLCLAFIALLILNLSCISCLFKWQCGRSQMQFINGASSLWTWRGICFILLSWSWVGACWGSVGRVVPLWGWDRSAHQHRFGLNPCPWDLVLLVRWEEVIPCPRTPAKPK